MNEKKLKELFEGSDAFIVATKNGTAVVGYNSEVLTLLTALVKSVRECKGIDDENIETVFRLSKLNEQETLKEALEVIKKMIDKM